MAISLPVEGGNRKISKVFGQYAHSCPDRSMKRKFEKVFGFFVKTHRPSPKRSRGKKFSRIGGQTRFLCPVDSRKRNFAQMHFSFPLGSVRRKFPQSSSKRLLADHLSSVRGNTESKGGTHSASSIRKNTAVPQGARTVL